MKDPLSVFKPPAFSDSALLAEMLRKPEPSPLARSDLGNWLREQLSHYTYKPNVKLEIIAGGYAAFFGAEYRLRVIATLEDTYRPGQTIEVVGYRDLFWAENYTEDMFGAMVAEYLKEFEIHESREWFKRDGVIVDDPHKGGRTP